MTPAQWTLLHRIVAADYGELFMRGADLRTARRLVDRGLIQPTSSVRWYKVTDKGRRVAAQGVA